MAIACIIDDDPIQQLLVERMLYKQKLCKQLYVYRNGLEAVNDLRKIHDADLFPDVIFLDINMPVMDGWGFLSEFQAFRERINKNIVIFMLSSSVWQDDIDRANNCLDVTDYLVKPLSMAQLSRAMSELTSR